MKIHPYECFFIVNILITIIFAIFTIIKSCLYFKKLYKVSLVAQYDESLKTYSRDIYGYNGVDLGDYDPIGYQLYYKIAEGQNCLNISTGDYCENSICYGKLTEEHKLKLHKLFL